MAVSQVGSRQNPLKTLHNNSRYTVPMSCCVDLPSLETCLHTLFPGSTHTPFTLLNNGHDLTSSRHLDGSLSFIVQDEPSEPSCIECVSIVPVS